jgi:outer membrane protein assembly factor BamB
MTTWQGIPDQLLVVCSGAVAVGAGIFVLLALLLRHRGAFERRQWALPLLVFGFPCLLLLSAWVSFDRVNRNVCAESPCQDSARLEGTDILAILSILAMVVAVLSMPAIARVASSQRRRTSPHWPGIALLTILVGLLDVAVAINPLLAVPNILSVNWPAPVPDPPPAAGLAWTLPGAVADRTPIMIRDGVVFVAEARRPALDAVDAATGGRLWQHLFGEGTSSLPDLVLSASGVAVVRDHGKLLGLDEHTGTVLWSLDPLPQSSEQVQGGAGDRIYRLSTSPAEGATVTRALLDVLDARSGRLEWSAELGPTWAVMATSEARVLVKTSSDGRLSARDARTGRVLWRVDGLATTYATPIREVGGIVYLLEPRRLRAFEAGTGAERWSTAVDPGDQNFVVQAGVIYLTDGDYRDGGWATNVRTVVDARTGMKKSMPVTGPYGHYLLFPETWNGLAYESPRGGTCSGLGARDLQSGVERWQLDDHADLTLDPTAVAAGTLYVQERPRDGCSARRSLIALDSATGRKAWEWTIYGGGARLTGDPCSHPDPAAGPDTADVVVAQGGMIFSTCAGQDEARIYAFRTRP